MYIFIMSYTCPHLSFALVAGTSFDPLSVGTRGTAEPKTGRTDHPSASRVLQLRHLHSHVS